MISKAHPQEKKALRALQTGGPAPPAIKIQGGKSKPMYQQVMQSLRQNLGDRETIEPFAGAGSLSLGFRPTQASLFDINPDLASFHTRLIDNPESLRFDPLDYTFRAGDPVMMENLDTNQMMNIGEVPEEWEDRFGDRPFYMGTKFYELRNKFNELRYREITEGLYESERAEKDRLFLLLQYMTNNGLLRYSPDTPSRASKYNSSLGGTPLPNIETPFESAYFDTIGKDKVGPGRGIMRGQGNTFRLQKLPGGEGEWNVDPWSEIMEEWQYIRRPIDELITSDDIDLDPNRQIAFIDPPYHQELGAHTFFDLSDQERVRALTETLVGEGMPVASFNSFTDEIVNPLRDMGLDIHQLARRDTSASKASSRGVKPELMAMANIPQNAFQQTWSELRNL